ncbi:MAG: helix-turn-helix domain-containing protein [Lentisphaerae bacterium]|jgi:AraC-like DNA-binding protein/ligand-binding sensor protein|nr:helix-turn-helix domain-containing protein [Lentisphaerota bacterium]MBT4814896.1 helix-turn-helix domain-containing protein [Lentisphaerota bacterium]MBT5609090.1 helix-turn-helix domain-containing protein [Lentisphaerota bacterium]MBT7057263.1 helix-turn-helix domain-containing protein [Lentisphaerota bacterium]MBT7848768.1 helix-turn-helix domain-containing protein [Lentisphaerota bacterium]
MSNHEMRFVFQRDIRGVLDHFSRLLSLRFCFLSPDGRELQVGEDKPFCRFCSMIRHQLGEASHCLDCDHGGWQRAAGSGRAVWYTCHAGMTDGCMAVRSGERIIGYMMIGQFRTQERCSTSVCERWDERYGNDDLQTAFLEAPFYTRAQVEDIMGVFSVLVDFIVSQRMIAVRGLEPIQPLLAYLSEHPDETLSTAEAAQLLHRSVSSFSHVFKESTGTSFLQYQIELKLDRADDLFRTRRPITVREVAFELGFRDPYYFSRLYRKHRGYPPSRALRAPADVAAATP